MYFGSSGLPATLAPELRREQAAARALFQSIAAPAEAAPGMPCRFFGSDRVLGFLSSAACRAGWLRSLEVEDPGFGVLTKLGGPAVAGSLGFRA